MKRTILTMLVMGIVLATAACLSADIINVNITEDNSVRTVPAKPVRADENFGDYVIGDHIVKLTQRGENSGIDEMRIILKASDIVSQLQAAGVTSSSEITSANLHMFRSGYSPAGTGGSFEVQTFRMTKDWVEGSSSGAAEVGASCWNYTAYNTTAWTTPGGDYHVGGYTDPGGGTRDFMGGWEQSIYSGGGGEEYISLATDAVKYWFDNPSENYGIMVKATLPSDIGQKEVYYKSSEQGSYVPFIAVDYIPEPATMLLLGGGLISLIAKRKRQ